MSARKSHAAKPLRPDPKKGFLTLALSKGKLLPPARAFLKRCDADLPAVPEDDRRLIFDLPEKGLRVLLVRATDVPTYVEHGVADVGIVGSDLLMEQVRDLYELADLPFGACRLVLAEPISKKRPVPQPQWPRHRSKIRVATKYPNLTEAYFSEKGIPIEIVKLYGSIELAPLVGLADQIVDLSESGETLKANQLVVVDEIVRCNARLVVNRASLRLKDQTLSVWIDRFTRAVK
jgi:ATP phosphoribosyltransferase